jgi:hypothetical protein
MKIKFFGEDYPEGLECDLPAVPRVGEDVAIMSPAGTVERKVLRVEWNILQHGGFVCVLVFLAPPKSTPSITVL